MSTQDKRLTCSASQRQGNQLQLTPEQSHYLQRVLRLRAGNHFIAVEQDRSWKAKLTGENCAELLEQLPPQPPLPVNIHLLAALPKTGFDDVVRQVTELGVETITPVLSARSLLKPSPKKLERWQRIAQEATEQCERPACPTIQVPCCWQAALAQIQTEQKYIAAARSDAQHLLTALPQTLDCNRIPDVVIAIGPEGGWTQEEVDQAIKSSYEAIILGSTILRAVTACSAAVTMIMGHYSACSPDV